MKRWIKCATYAELPWGDNSQPLHEKNTKDPEEIDRILFGTPLTQINILDAIRNPNTSSKTLAKLAPYVSWDNEEDAAFSDYIHDSRAPKDARAKLIVEAMPRIADVIENGETADYQIHFPLLRMYSVMNELDLDQDTKDSIEYYFKNYKRILKSIDNRRKAEKRSKIKGDMTEFTNKQLLAYLQANGIDTTMSQYELKAEEYERYSAGSRYTKKFKCAGDWLAYFSMAVHRTPSANAISEWLEDDVEYFKELVAEYPTVDDIAEHAASTWWGDGDDYIISLKNISTGEVLYQGEEPEEEYDEDEDWD